MHRLKDFRINLMTHRFGTFILPILEYASQIWSPKLKLENKIVEIESIQKHFLKHNFHGKTDFIYHHTKINYFFYMNTLEDRRLIYQIIFIKHLV